MTNQLQQHHHHRHHNHRTVDLRISAIERYAYCLCLHVKPTTIFIAAFKLIRALLFASILLNSEFTAHEQWGPELSMDERHRSTAIALSIFTGIIVASVSALGIYAVISGRAALLMPLYAILLVDFFFALPTFYNRDMDPAMAEGFEDFRRLPKDNQYARYSSVLFATIIMMVKIYFLCVVWKCYRYLRLIELVSPIRILEIYPNAHQGLPFPTDPRVLGSEDSTDSSITGGINLAPPPYDAIASSMKPPNYEEAIKSSPELRFDLNLATIEQQLAMAQAGDSSGFVGSPANNVQQPAQSAQHQHQQQQQQQQQPATTSPSTRLVLADYTPGKLTTTTSRAISGPADGAEPPSDQPSDIAASSSQAPSSALGSPQAARADAATDNSSHMVEIELHDDNDQTSHSAAQHQQAPAQTSLGPASSSQNAGNRDLEAATDAVSIPRKFV